jgi:hypothetical protein
MAAEILHPVARRAGHIMEAVKQSFFVLFWEKEYISVLKPLYLVVFGWQLQMQ